MKYFFAKLLRRICIISPAHAPTRNTTQHWKRKQTMWEELANKDMGFGNLKTIRQARVHSRQRQTYHLISSCITHVGSSRYAQAYTNVISLDVSLQNPSSEFLFKISLQHSSLEFLFASTFLFRISLRSFSSKSINIFH